MKQKNFINTCILGHSNVNKQPASVDILASTCTLNDLTEGKNYLCNYETLITP